MKLILCLSVLLLLSTAPVAFSELTADDLEKIREIVEKEVNESKQELKEDISQEIGKVYIKIEEMDRRLTGEIKTLGKRLNHIFMLVLALVAFVGVVVGIPQIIVAMQRKDIRAQDEKIEAQQKQIEALQQELETRNPERIVRP